MNENNLFPVQYGEKVIFESGFLSDNMNLQGRQGKLFFYNSDGTEAFDMAHSSYSISFGSEPSMTEAD